MIN
ncbi:hypothetical protein YPPY91_2630, partial [Yersinia pestis PY-91]|jgi:hypothetical protein